MSIVIPQREGSPQQTGSQHLNRPFGADLDAGLYRKNSQLQQDLSGQLLASCQFPSRATILDVGCGDGRVTRNLLDKVPLGRVIGIDASPNMIELAQRTYAQHSNLEFRLARAEELKQSQLVDGASSGINGVVSFSCLHWVPQPKKTINKLCQFLAGNGELVILTYPKESKFYEFMDAVLAEHYPAFRRQSAYYTMLKIKEYEEAILEAGLNITHFEAHDKIASFDDVDALKKFIRSWLVNFVALPENEHERFLNFAGAKSEEYRLDLMDDRIHLPYTALTIKGKKSEGQLSEPHHAKDCQTVAEPTILEEVNSNKYLIMVGMLFSLLVFYKVFIANHVAVVVS